MSSPPLIFRNEPTTEARRWRLNRIYDFPASLLPWIIVCAIGRRERLCGHLEWAVGAGMNSSRPLPPPVSPPRDELRFRSWRRRPAWASVWVGDSFEQLPAQPAPGRDLDDMI